MTSGYPLHRILTLCVVTASIALGCGAKDPATNGAASAAKPVPPPPYSYPAPVSGHFKDVNTGEFDFVDGLAYPARQSAAGTVVLVTAKSIASPILAASTCPATQARALTLLRNSGYVELTLDAKGSSDYYIEGTPYGSRGRSQQTGSREWRGEIRIAAGRAKGFVDRRTRGRFEFDLPVAQPQATEVSENDRMQAGYAAWGGNAAAPTEVEAITAYDTTRRAALDSDLGKYLALQGFDQAQADAIRGLAGIEADFAAHRDRFLDPGAPEPSTLANGFASIGARGLDPKGKAFANYYEFTPCAGHLILTSIGVNPQ